MARHHCLFRRGHFPSFEVFLAIFLHDGGRLPAIVHLLVAGWQGRLDRRQADGHSPRVHRVLIALRVQLVVHYLLVGRRLHLPAVLVPRDMRRVFKHTLDIAPCLKRGFWCIKQLIDSHFGVFINELMWWFYPLCELTLLLVKILSAVLGHALPNFHFLKLLWIVFQVRHKGGLISYTRGFSDRGCLPKIYL